MGQSIFVTRVDTSSSPGIDTQRLLVMDKFSVLTEQLFVLAFYQIMLHAVSLMYLAL